MAVVQQKTSYMADHSIKAKKRDIPWIVIFLIPFLVLYFTFTLWPLLATLFYSFFDWNGLGPIEDFVKLDNYIRIASDKSFWLAFWNTIWFAVANTVIKIPLSLLTAILLTRRWLKHQYFFRTMFFLPIVVPVAMAGLIFTFLLNPFNGAVNDVLMSLNLIAKPIDFLGNPKLSMWSLILISVWQIFGQYMIYWMAALQNVPESLYEAAEIDGAGEWDKLTKITIPMIRPVAVTIVFLAFVNALRVFGLVVTLTSGGPGQSTSVISYFIYNQAFVNLPFQYGYASAAALLFGVIVLIAVSIQGYFVNRAEKDRADYGV